MNTHEDEHRESWLIILGVIVVVIVVMSLFVTIVSSQQQDAAQKTKTEKVRADLLQQSVNNLRARLVTAAQLAEQDRRFFELVRQLLVAQGIDQKKALANELKTFKFSEPQATPTTPTTSKPRSTPTTRAPPSSTTTTSTTRPPSPPPTTCVIAPVVNRQICH